MKTKRAKITDFIAKQKSRHEFLPLLGNFLDKAHVEPLHLKNNAWQFFFKALLEEDRHFCESHCLDNGPHCSSSLSPSI